MAIGFGELLIVLFVLVFVVGGTAFWIWALVDCIQKEPANDNVKVVWIVVIAVTGWIGALLYLLIRRPERQRIAASGARQP